MLTEEPTQAPQPAEAPGSTRAHPNRIQPAPAPNTPGVQLLPPTRRYRLKNKMLGPPLHTEALEEERLGRPTALAVFASDNLSSSAYATEEILRVLVPIVGLAAFALVVPITIAMLVVLGFLILSYRQTIKAYPTAGGAYMVTRDNFGLLPAQVAGVALLTDYVLTVSVSVAAGTAALASAFPMFTAWILPISVVFVVIIAYGNLRGVRESGKVFAVPTYFFIVNMVALLGWGLYQMTLGHLPKAPTHAHGLMHFGVSGGGLLLGASAYVVMHAFASGGAAVTGVEAISNGVPAFKKPEWKNARSTLVVMGTLLGAMFLGVSVLAAHMHVGPFDKGTPTVISQVGDLVYGSGGFGRVLYFSLQAGTMLILVLAANTSFADFPRLASFHAGDHFMPRQLTKRGHRLVFSNGIIFLSIAAIVLLLATDAKVDRLIPLYAIGVFTSFTLSQAGMAKHHIREKEEGWRWGLFVNGMGAVLSFVVDIVIAVTKFAHGAWVIIVLVPIMVFFLVRLAKQYEREAVALEIDVPKAVVAPVRKRLTVMVFIDTFDLAVVRAMQFGRALRPDDLRAVHFVIDQQHADELAAEWRKHGMANLALECIECPDRRITRAAVETVAHELSSGDAEVCVLLPERMYNGVWHRILHDQTAEALSREISKLPHANVTTVPFHFDDRAGATTTADVDANGSKRKHGNGNGNGKSKRASTSVTAPALHDDGTTPIGSVHWRQQVRLSGRVTAVRVEPLAGNPSLEYTLSDGTGGISVVFFGRRGIGGITIGTTMTVEGMSIDHHGRLAIVNPVYQIK
ncbi:MAG: nucleic acid binding OB-fold tRNA/helicase-type [Actinomycetia bacterium]|nr:nucleic acid binding OB-fold tRNA/helicase-type [Actinomycetes bacterium]